MIYQLYQAHADVLSPIRRLARFGAMMTRVWDLGGHTPLAVRHLGASLSLLAETQVTHHRPAFGIKTVRVGDQDVDVTEAAADTTPFGTLLHFRKEGVAPQPRVLLVAPMSGHFATLLRGTIKAILPDHDLYLTDWKNARDIPVSDGVFGLDEFTDHLIRFMRVLGPGAHMVAVCQPAVAALAATAVMAEDKDPAQPRSLTLMAGPIDTRVNPTKVNELAMSHPYEWFEKQVIARVPWRHPGGGRRVYPGFLQLTAFVSMNLDRHVAAHRGQFRALVDGDTAAAAAHRAFYDEYSAVMDLPAEFFLETIRRVFQEHHLPRGCLTWHGNPVRPAAIRRTALLTVEGERDDICGIGQTMAALDLCTGVPISRKEHYLQAGAGHYGVFSGRRWEQEIYPRVRQMIQVNS
jgi:poly(3-hydroxybutyrate) depolymerase